MKMPADTTPSANARVGRHNRIDTNKFRVEAAMAFQGKPPKKYWGDQITIAEFQQIVKGTDAEATDEEAEWVRAFCEAKGIPYVAGGKCFMCGLRLPDGSHFLRHEDCVPSCMYCAKEFDTKEELEAHEDECM